MTTTTQLNRIATQQERAMLRTFNAILSDIRDNAVIFEITRAIETNNLPAVYQLLGMDEATWAPMDEAIRSAYNTGGITGAAQIGRVPVDAGTLVARFNVRNPRAETWIASESSRLITEIVQDQQAMVRNVLADGLANGRAPRATALDIIGRVDRRTGQRTGGFIGLTEQQQGWVSNARAELEGLDPNYFTRRLRDQRFDGAVRRAIESGRPLDAATIDRAITNMQARGQRYRGEVIARTESINALRAGQHESVTQAMDTGELDGRDVMKAWDASGDVRTRPAHADADGQTVPFDQPFIVDGEPLAYPGDPDGSAANTIQCRCRERVVINFGQQVRRLEGFG